MKFVPEKYELIHFSRKRRRNAQAEYACLTLPNALITPSTEIKILGIWLDPKLKWGAYIKAIEGKMERQMAALTRVTAFTWGATFARARQVYSAIIRPVMIYGAGIWYTPSLESRMRPAGAARHLSNYQNKCLRTVARAYKATPTQILEVEICTPPLNIYLDSRVAAFRQRLRISGTGRVIEQACERLRTRFRNRRRRRRRVKITPDLLKDQWKERWLNATRSNNDFTDLEELQERTPFQSNQTCFHHWQRA